MLDELPALIAAGYEQVDEEDIVRLKWWGLYHDKPKIGTFMLRIKIPAASSSPAQLRAIGEISNVLRPRRGRAHDAPERAAPLPRARSACPTSSSGCTRPGSTSAGACGDTVRNITGCPVAGRRARRAVRPDAGARGGGGALLRQSRTTPTCRVSTRSRSPRASTVAPRPRSTASRWSARFATARRASACSSAAGSRRCRESRVTSGSGCRRTRRSRCWRRSWTSGGRICAIASRACKARLKFMIDDIGPEGMRELVEARLGQQLDDFVLPQAPPPGNHLGVRAQKRRPLLVGVPVHLGLISGDQMVALPSSPSLGHDVADHAPAELRAHRTLRMSLAVEAGSREIGLPLDAGALRGDAIACTGEPHCNFSVTETKSRMDGLVQLLEQRFGDDDRRLAPAPRRLPARLRAALGRRPRLPGHDGARRRGQAPSGLRRLPARQPRPAGGDRAAGLQARSDRGARRRRHRPRRRLGRRTRRGREHSGRSATARPTTSSAPGRPRAGQDRRRRQHDTSS